MTTISPIVYNGEDDENPMHFYLSRDAPIHLHFGQTKLDRNTETESTRRTENHSLQFTSNPQAPWVPPPAKTTPGKQNTKKAVTVRRKNIKNVRASKSDCSSEQAISPNRSISYHDMHASPFKYGSTKDTRRTASLTRRERIDNWDDDRMIWTTTMMDGWIEDIDRSMSQLSKKIKDLEQHLANILIQGKRLTSKDLDDLSIPRHEIMHHGGIVKRASHELCRWAASICQQQHTDHMNRQPEQREMDLTRESDNVNQELARTRHELEDVKNQLVTKQSETNKFTSVNASLDSLRAHLQRELRQREADCSRLTTQVRNLESKLATERATLRTRLETTEENVQQLRETKEALKRVARWQKKRIEQTEEALKQALGRLKTEGEVRTDDSDQNHQENEERMEAQGECTHCGQRLSDTRLDGMNLRTNHSRKEQGDHPHESSGSRAFLREENRRLKCVARSCEQRLVEAKREVEAMRTYLAECESYRGNNDGYHKIQGPVVMRRQYLQAMDTSQCLEQAKENKEIQVSQESYLNAVHKHDDDIPTELLENRQLIAELRRQLDVSKQEKIQTESQTQVRLADLRAQLLQTDATNRSLQAYLTFLKRSYTSVFQADLTVASPWISSYTAFNNLPTKMNAHLSGTNHQIVHNGSETPNICDLSLHAVHNDDQ